MTSECINNWRDQVKRESISTMGEIMAKYISLKGNTSTSESFQVAINFACFDEGPSLELNNKSKSQTSETSQMVPVIFMISV